MQGQEHQLPKHPIMTTVQGRPTAMMARLQSADGVSVQCRLPTGEDAFVPLTEIFRLFEAELVTKIRMQSGGIS